MVIAHGARFMPVCFATISTQWSEAWLEPVVGPQLAAAEGRYISAVASLDAWVLLFNRTQLRGPTDEHFTFLKKEDRHERTDGNLVAVGLSAGKEGNQRRQAD